MRRGLARVCVLFLLPALLLSGCWQDDVSDENTGIVDSSAATSASSSGGKAEISLPNNLFLPYYPTQTLDPITCADGIQQTVGALLYEGLFELDQKFQPQKVLCTSSSYDPAALTWTFTLRSGVLFSDGTALTASDVTSSLNRARTAPRYQARLSGIASVSASGAATVTVVLSAADSQLPALLDIPIIKSGTEGNLVPTGTGPYAFSSDDKGGASLKSNSKWWRGHSQPVSSIILVAEDNRDSMLYQFSSHEIQLITADLTGTDPVSATGNISFYDADTTIFQYVGFNTSSEVFTDAALRSALSLGINRSGIVSAFLSGHAVPAQFPLSPSSSLYPADLEETYSYENYEKAMKAAGYDSGKTRGVTLIVNQENSFKLAAARQIAEELSAFDLKVTVKALPWTDYTAALADGKYDLYYGEVKLSANWNLGPLLATGGALNYGRYADPTLDLLLQECASAAAPENAVRSVCSYLKKQAPILPVCFKRVSVLTQSGVIGNLTPTAANPFYDIGSCTIHLAK